MKRKIGLFVFLFSIFCVLPAGAAAGERTEPMLGDLLGTEISAAAKYMQTTAEAPASVAIITSEDIERFGYRTLDQVLNRVRGFYITNDRSYTYLGVRGISRPADYNNRVLLLINGNATNDNFWGSAYMGREMGLHVDAIERIEIVRGPGSALYGANAVLAVINIVTKKGKTLDGLNVTFQSGSYGLVQGSFSYGKEFKNGLDLFFSAQVGDVKGEDLYYEEYDDPATNNGIAEGLDWEKYHGLFAFLKYKGISVQAMLSDRKKGIPTAAFETIFNDDRTKTDDAFGFVELKYDDNLSYKTRLMVRTYYQHYLYRGAFAYGFDDYKTLWEEETLGKWFGVETQFNWDIGPDNRLVLGCEYKKHIDSSYRAWDEFETEFDQNFPFNEFSVYIQDEHQLVANLNLTLGLRYDRFSNRDKKVTPRLALVYNPSRSTTLKCLYGNAYRAPNIYEIYYESVDEAKNNLSLKHEKVNTFEVVLEQQLNNRLVLTMSAYTFEMRGLIEQVTDPEDDLWQFVNLERVRGRGLELGLDMRLKSGLRGYAAYTYQESKSPDQAGDEPISNSPSHLFKVGVSIPCFKHFYASLEAHCESGRLTLQGNRTKRFALIDAHLSSRKLFDLVRFSLRVENLLDTSYFFPVGYEHLQDVLEQNGRRFTFKIELNF